MHTKASYLDNELMIENDGIHMEAIKAANYQQNEENYFVKTFCGPFQNTEQIMSKYK